MQGVYVKTYPAPDLDSKEALRYAGYLGSEGGETEERITACFLETEKEFSYGVCYAVCSVDELISFLGRESENWLLSRLCDAERVAVFCATVGLGIDRRILRYSVVSPTKALLFQALGTERVESLCEAFCRDLQREYQAVRVGRRFSPGYGNIPLEVQRAVFALLDCSRKLGVSLNDSLLMTPSKSVTAFVPIGVKTEKTGKKADCKACDKTDCALRKE